MGHRKCKWMPYGRSAPTPHTPATATATFEYYQPKNTIISAAHTLSPYYKNTHVAVVYHRLCSRRQLGQDATIERGLTPSQITIHKKAKCQTAFHAPMSPTYSLLYCYGWSRPCSPYHPTAFVETHRIRYEKPHRPLQL
jgi:hypothetical protein